MPAERQFKAYGQKAMCLSEEEVICLAGLLRYSRPDEIAFQEPGQNRRLDMPTVIASSFADPQDVAKYRKAIAEGKTEAQALKVGDNGIGKWGDNTAGDDIPMCALPPEDWMEKWGSSANARGKKVSVSYKGKTVVGELRDTMPHKANIKNGAGIDLNPGFAKAFNVTPPFMLFGVEWEWA